MKTLAYDPYNKPQLKNPLKRIGTAVKLLH